MNGPAAPFMRLPCLKGLVGDWILRRDRKDNCRAALAILMFCTVVLGLFFFTVFMEKEGKAAGRGKEEPFWSVTVRYHSNYPTGEDLIYEVRCLGREKAWERDGCSIGRLFSYTDCGFGGYLPLSDGHTWYLEKECITQAGRLYLKKNTACDLYAGWKRERRRPRGTVRLWPGF